MWILRINMTDRSYQLEDVPNAYKLLGGRGLTSTIVHDEVPPLCHPLGPNNKLVFAPGIVTGTAASTSARISVGAKSPLTNGIGETRCEGRFAVSLKKSGYDAIIVHGVAESPLGLMIDNGQVSFFEADELWGQNVGEATDSLEAKFGGDVDVPLAQFLHSGHDYGGIIQLMSTQQRYPEVVIRDP